MTPEQRWKCMSHNRARLLARSLFCVTNSGVKDFAIPRMPDLRDLLGRGPRTSRCVREQSATADGPNGPFSHARELWKASFPKLPDTRNAALACGVCLADCIARRGRDYVLITHILSFYFITNQLINLLFVELFH